MAKDILINDSGFILRNGDFMIGESSEQEMVQLIMGSPGGSRWNGKVGLGARRYTNKRDGLSFLRRDILEALTADGMENINWSVGSDGQPIITANNTSR